MSVTFLGVLGYFPFTTTTVPFQELSETKTYKHPTHQTVGAMNPPSQFTGKESSLTINAELRPEITGGNMSIALLEKMADTGQPWPLILGRGKLMGSYVITKISKTESELMHSGAPRSIQFSMDLQKVSDQPFGLMGEAIGLGVGLVRTLTGI